MSQYWGDYAVLSTQRTLKQPNVSIWNKLKEAFSSFSLLIAFHFSLSKESTHKREVEWSEKKLSIGTMIFKHLWMFQAIIVYFHITKRVDFHDFPYIFFKPYSLLPLIISTPSILVNTISHFLCLFE